MQFNYQLNIVQKLEHQYWNKNLIMHGRGMLCFGYSVNDVHSMQPYNAGFAGVSEITLMFDGISKSDQTSLGHLHRFF